MNDSSSVFRSSIEKIKRYLSPVYWYLRSRIPGLNTIELTVDGITAEYRLDSHMEHRLLTKFSERFLVSDVLSGIKSDDIFYDIGANIGLYSCLVANAGVGVVAFEPDDIVREKLKQNAEMAAGNVDVCGFSLSNKTATVDIDVNKNWSKKLGRYSFIRAIQL